VVPGLSAGTLKLRDGRKKKCPLANERSVSPRCGEQIEDLINRRSVIHYLIFTYLLLPFCGVLKQKNKQEIHQEMTYPNVTSLSFTPLAFNAPTDGFTWDDLRKILH